MKIISITVDILPESCEECMNVGICGLDLFKQGCFAFELKKDFQTSRHPDCPLVEQKIDKDLRDCYDCKHCYTSSNEPCDNCNTQNDKWEEKERDSKNGT